MPDAPSTEKCRTAINRALIAFFIIVLCLPFLDSVFQMDRSPIPKENRTLAPFPRYRGLKNTALFVAGFETYFNDHFGFRKLLIRVSNHLKETVFYDSSGKVLIGRDGWLYWSGDRMIDHYCAGVRFGDLRLHGWQVLLETRRNWLRKFGAKYIFVIVPDKQTVYPEHLPKWLVKSDKPSKVDQFVAYMKAHSSVEILDLRQPLIEAKETAPLYCLTDTHWNSYGAFLGLQKLIAALSRQMPGLKPLPLNAFDYQLVSGPGGDLAVAMGQEEMKERQDFNFTPRPPLKPFQQSTIAAHGPYTLGPTITTDNPHANGKAVLFRDSFAGAWVPFLGYYFNHTTYVWQYQWDETFLQQERPDVVVDEIVERLFNIADPVEWMGADRLSLTQ